MDVFKTLGDITRPSYEPPEDHQLISLSMNNPFEEKNKADDLLKFVQWISALDVVYVGTDMWKIGNDHLNDKALIEKYLEAENN